MQLAAAAGGDPERAAVELEFDPVGIDKHLKQGGSECAGEMHAALAPVQTSIGEFAPRGTSAVQIHSQRGQPSCSFLDKLKGVGAGGTRAQPAKRAKTLQEPHGNSSGHVVVAAARQAKGNGCRWLEPGPGCAGEHADAFQGVRYPRRFQDVVAMLALRMHRDQVLRLETIQVRACSGRRNVRHEGKLRTGSCAAIEQANEHTRACGLSYGRCYPRNSGIRGFDIHCFTLTEVFLHGNAHTGRG